VTPPDPRPDGFDGDDDHLDLPAPVPASGAMRALARIIDYLLVGLVLLAVSQPFAVTETFVDGGETRERIVFDGPAWVSVILALIPVAYEVAMVLWRGQTLGKLAARLRVVREDGTPPDLRAALLRAAIPGAILAVPGLAVLGLPVVMAVYASALVMGGRGVVDRVAKTTVVRV
jgi:uncharacterized RDD family membrane protein YckC